MIRRLLLASVMTLCIFTTGSGVDAQNSQMTYPPAPLPNPDKLITPPGETTTFPMRADGQAVYINEDITVNFTEALNRYYFNPKLRGEEWGPYQTYWIPERGIRMMATWEELDQFSILRVGNKWHKFMEKYSGYGP